MAKSKLIEKIGYGFGDMSSSMFWKIFSYYLPIFYSHYIIISCKINKLFLEKKKERKK